MSLDAGGKKIPLGPTEQERRAGRILERTLYHSNRAPKDLQHDLDHASTNKISGWFAGNDIPKLLVALLNDEDYRIGLAKAIAEVPGDRLPSAQPHRHRRGRVMTADFARDLILGVGLILIAWGALGAIQILSRLGPDRGMEIEARRLGARQKFIGFDEQLYLRFQRRQLQRAQMALELRRLHLRIRRHQVARRMR